jgi:hypothetical protein
MAILHRTLLLSASAQSLMSPTGSAANYQQPHVRTAPAHGNPVYAIRALASDTTAPGRSRRLQHNAGHYNQGNRSTSMPTCVQQSDAVAPDDSDPLQR